MPLPEYLEWYTYYRLTKFGDETARTGFGLLAALISNLFEKRRPKQISDFFPDPFKADQMTWQQAKAVFRMCMPSREGRYGEDGSDQGFTS